MEGNMGNLRVLHIAANYPDGVFKQPTTDAVKNLTEETTGSLQHTVVSIARRWPWQGCAEVMNQNVLSISYPGLPLGAFHRLFSRFVARRIWAILDAAGVRFDVIHGHKLTVEGGIACELARLGGKPYLVTVRGFTDERLIKMRLDARAWYGDILAGAAGICVPAPWTKEMLERYFASHAKRAEWSSRVTCLPNIVGREQFAAGITVSNDNGRYVTIFRAGRGGSKGFRDLLHGMAELQESGKELALDVIGCEEESEEGAWVKEFGLRDSVTFCGALPNAVVLERLRQYRALLLPSKNETFGMVYAEALLLGVPILYVRHTGIDGYWDDLDVGVGVLRDDMGSLVRGLEGMLDRHAHFRRTLAAALGAGKLDFLKPSVIAKSYMRLLTDAMERSRH